MKALFYANKDKDKDLRVSSKVIEDLLNAGFMVYVIDPELVSDSVGLATDEELEEVDVAIILGGDGTILKFARDYSKYNLPIYGINFGRVGALAIGEMSSYQKDLPLIERGEFILDDRYAISCQISEKGVLTHSLFAFNEFSIYRGESVKLLGIDIEINEKYAAKIYADGLLISTSTGSSAYNRSAGGPLILPSSNSYVLTPICPQFPALTSVVCDSEDEVRLRVNSEDAFLSVDGCDKVLMNSNQEIVVKKSDEMITFIDFNQKKSLYSSIYKIAMSIYKE